LDGTGVDGAGRLLLKQADKLELHMVNGTTTCKGVITRVAETANSSDTAIDYVFVSEGLLPHVESMLILSDRMGSDHHPALVRLRNLRPTPGAGPGMREVWRTDKIPHYKDKDKLRTFVEAYQSAFSAWTSDTSTQIHALKATEADNTVVSNLVEHSFEKCLHEVTNTVLGKRSVGPSAVPRMTTAIKVLNSQRLACELALRAVVHNANSNEEERSLAVSIYREAKAKALRAGAARKEMMELKMFKDIERNQADSKLFWQKAKGVMSGLRSSVSPPPMIQLFGESCETDPIKVLKGWRNFTKAIANPGQEEECMYDNDHKLLIEERLEQIKRLKNYQAVLDDPITKAEIYQAIRKLKVGKAAGVDDILTSILKPAADAVGNSKLRNNPVVDALELLFNFVFENEVWPERWGQGIIFPLYKDSGSRLDPGNYRPIALLSQIGKIFGSVVENRLSDWSEKTLAIADEQGGFRRKRGTPDLIFLLRETILGRKAVGQPTLTTFIDARKAYDSVWKEGNMVRLFESGVHGKLWRQLQAMSSDRSSKIRLPFGETDFFEVTRGVAQGAAESPWLYSCFINGLAEELKSKGLGVRIAGILTPLLMYADDVVLLAATVEELRTMNQVVTDYAFKNRYQLNGEKSAVMVFNANKQLERQVATEPWKLSGEVVEVKKTYKYLGVDLLSNVSDWTKYVARAIAKATRVSEDLSWMCRRDNGLLPRTAATLWKAIARPVLEYAAELWAGDIPLVLANKAEAVQTNFARSILDLAGCQSISNDVLRSELGMEKLSARWEKLRLGYWRRIHQATSERTLHFVVSLRRWQVEHAPPAFNNGWMKPTKKLLQDRGLFSYWQDPNLCSRVPKLDWKDTVYEAVEEHDTASIQDRLALLSSETAARYSRIKNWGEVGEDFACFSGEVGRRGALVPEPYLDDREEPVGRKLKLMCRTGCLPILKRVAREESLPVEAGRCKMCTSGEVETISHFVVGCEAYGQHRAKMQESIQAGLRGKPLVEALDMLLGKSTGTVAVDECVDRAVKRFLKKAWRDRKWLTVATNTALGRSDTPWALKAHGDKLSRSYWTETKPTRARHKKNC